MIDEEPEEELLRRDPPDDGERDALEGLGTLPRVLAVHTVMTPIHREPPPAPPAQPQVKPAVALHCNPFIPTARKPQMRTMSDLGGTDSGFGGARAVKQ